MGSSRIFLKFTSLSIILFFFLSCGSGDETPNSGNFRFIQLSPDSPILDLLIDNESIASDFEFLDNTGFTKGPKESFNLKLTPSNSENQIAANFLNQNLNEIDSSKTYISTGFYRSNPSNTIIEIETDRTPADGNEAQLKWIHASPSMASVPIDVYLVPPDNNCTQGLASVFPIVTDLSYGDGDSDYRPVDSGIYDVCIIPVSNSFDGFIINNYDFASRVRLTLIVYENIPQSSFGLYILDDVTGKEEIQNP